MSLRSWLFGPTPDPHARCDAELARCRERELELLRQIATMVDARAQYLLTRSQAEASRHPVPVPDPLTPDGSQPMSGPVPRSLRLPPLVQSLVGGGHANLDRERTVARDSRLAKGRMNPSAG